MAAQLTLINGRSRCALRLCTAGDQFLAGAGFTGDQHRAAGRRHQLDATDHIFDSATLADDAIPLKMRPPFISVPLSSAPRGSHQYCVCRMFTATCPRWHAGPFQLVVQRPAE